MKLRGLKVFAIWLPEQIWDFLPGGYRRLVYIKRLDSIPQPTVSMKKKFIQIVATLTLKRQTSNVATFLMPFESK